MGPGPRRAAVPIAIAAALALIAGEPSWAHDGIAGRIEAVNLQIQTTPANAELLVRRAELYRLGREWKLAAADLDRAASLNPDLPALDLVRAHLLADTGRFQAAADAASRVLGRDANHLDALLVRARARTQLGQWREAAADFSLVLDARPLPDLYVERARTLSAPRASNLTGALAGLEAGIARLGPLVTLELEAIDIELRLKRYDAALGRLERVSVQATRKDSWLARRAEILEQAGKVDEARAAYGAALAATMSTSSSRPSPASEALIARLRTRLGRLESTSAPRIHHEGAQ